MRFVVVDASVAVKWYINEEGSEKAINLLDDEDLLRQWRQSQLTDEALDKALSDVPFSAPELVASPRLLDRAVTLAKSLSHLIYDCLYLALAERWETVLVTADAEFVTRCRHRLAGEPITERLRLLNEFAP